MIAFGRAPTGTRGATPLLLAALVLAWSGCSSFSLRRTPPPPGRTTLESPLVELPAQSIGNYLVIEAKWDRYGPYHFVVDTASSVTLINPALAKRYPGRTVAQPNAPHVRVRDADGRVSELTSGWLRQLVLGDAHFDEVPVLLYDCAALSAHLGVRIDGILGFPLFRETLLTLDYPAHRVALRPARTETLLPGTVIRLDDTRKTPLIPLRLGERSVAALIDSGSDADFSLNPAGLDLSYAQPPRPAGVVGTLAGDRSEEIARLAGTIAIGDYTFAQPIVNLTDELSAVGGGVLKNFAVTFDQQRDRVIFQRDSRDPITMPPRRSAGVSFTKAPAYWRVAGVVPGSSAATAGIERGDLVVRINGEPIAKWDLRRYRELEGSAAEITFTLLNGNTETEKRVGVFELVP